MKITNFKICVAAIACALLAGPAYALTINDPGVVGTVEAGTQNSSVDNEVDWANYLLAMTASDTDTADGNVPTDGTTENYQTSSTDYNGTLSGGTQGPSCDDSPGTCTDVSGYDYVIAKYDGQNAGYVVFYVPVYGDTIPSTSETIWTNTQEQGYGLSHFTGFSVSVPDGGATLMLLGAALGGLGVARRFMKI